MSTIFQVPHPDGTIGILSAREAELIRVVRNVQLRRAGKPYTIVLHSDGKAWRVLEAIQPNKTIPLDSLDDESERPAQGGIGNVPTG